MPVDRRVVADSLGDVVRDQPQRVITQYFHGAVVDFQSVVERDFILGQSQTLASGLRVAHLLGQLEQSLDHLRHFDTAGLVAGDGVL